VFLGLFPLCVFTIVAGILHPHGIVFVFEIQQHFAINQLLIGTVLFATSNLAYRMNKKVCQLK